MQRDIKCQICERKGKRYCGTGLLVKPCPECGSLTTFAIWMLGDQLVTPDPKLNRAPRQRVGQMDSQAVQSRDHGLKLGRRCRKLVRRSLFRTIKTPHKDVLPARDLFT
jgi:hypothetical protein